MAKNFYTSKLQLKSWGCPSHFKSYMIKKSRISKFMFYSCSWISSRSLKETIPMFLLLLSDMVLFLELSCSLSPVQISQYFSLYPYELQQLTLIGIPLCTACCHPRQEPVFQLLWHEILVVNLLSYTHPINNWQFETKNVFGNNNIPKQLCWPHDLPFPDALRPRTSPLRAAIIVSLSWTWQKMLYLLNLYLFEVPCEVSSW